MDVDDFVPIVAIGGVFAMIMWREYLNHRAKQLLHDERRLQIEKGQVPPALPVLAGESELLVQRSLRRGIILLCVGIGIGISYALGSGTGLPGPANRGVLTGAVIVTLLGIGNLVYYYVARRPPSQA